AWAGKAVAKKVMSRQSAGRRRRSVGMELPVVSCQLPRPARAAGQQRQSETDQGNRSRLGDRVDVETAEDRGGIVARREGKSQLDADVAGDRDGVGGGPEGVGGRIDAADRRDKAERMVLKCRDRGEVNLRLVDRRGRDGADRCAVEAAVDDTGE